MFVRLKTVTSGSRCYRYVQIVENRRDQGKVRQRVVANLGPLEGLEAAGDLGRIIEGLAKLVPRPAVGGSTEGAPAPARWGGDLQKPQRIGTAEAEVSTSSGRRTP